MKLTTNKYDKPFWVCVKSDSKLTSEHFHEVDMSSKFLEKFGKKPDVQQAFHCNLGSITVLDRMTGFSFGRDTETGFHDVDGKFWLASGMFDIRDYLPLSFSDAVSLIKQNANNCIGE